MSGEALDRKAREAGGPTLAALAALATPGPRVLQAAIHGVWCTGKSLDQPPAWGRILALYDARLTHRDDPVVRLNPSRSAARADAAAGSAGVTQTIVQRQV
jgi:RNA polymerase sigma-70 factor (ECF subfamily)